MPERASALLKKTAGPGTARPLNGWQQPPADPTIGTRRILYVLGSRSSMVKVAPVVAALRARFRAARHVLVSADHDYDRGLFALLQDEFALPDPGFVLDARAGGRLGRIAHALERLERVIDLERPGLAVVAGDADSCVAAALAASKAGIPTAHVEAGLRSFDRTIPEETNRVVSDELASWLFADCDEAVRNLEAKGIGADRVHLVGSTAADTLARLDHHYRELGASRRLGLAPGAYVLVVIRGRMLASRGNLWEALDGLRRDVGTEAPLVLAVDPGLRSMLDRYPGLVGLRLAEAPDYPLHLSLVADAAAVVTDAADVEEEATLLHTPCASLRPTIERRASLGHVLTASRDGAGKPGCLDDARAGDLPPLWDGKASERIAAVIERTLDPGERPERQSDLEPGPWSAQWPV